MHTRWQEGSYCLLYARTLCAPFDRRNTITYIFLYVYMKREREREREREKEKERERERESNLPYISSKCIDMCACTRILV